MDAPNRATTIPEGSTERKQHPVSSGVLDYFPDALVAIANVSWKGNEQHNPGTPVHWDRAKSTDEADCLIRHFLQRGMLDTDGIRHSAKMAWRALALLQKELEAEDGVTCGPGGVYYYNGQRACNSRQSGSPGFTCTRRMGHLGSHAATDINPIREWA